MQSIYIQITPNTILTRGNNYPSTKKIPREKVPQRKTIVGIYK